MKLKFICPFGFGLVVILLFVSCQSEIEPTTVTTTAAVTLIRTAMPQSSLEPTIAAPIAAIEVETTSNPAPDSTKSPTVVPQTAIPTLVVPTIAVATLTPLPTFVANELETSIEDLLANPMNCDVPCWWGAIPGTTTINDIKHTLAPYNFDISEYEEGEHLVILRLGIGYVKERNDFRIRIGYGFFDSVLTGVAAYSPSISEFLTKYGQPDEIWLSTVSFMRDGNLSVRLNLVYLQEGMAAGYVVDGNIQDSMVIGCFTDEETGQLRLIAPNSATSYKDFSPIFEEDRRYIAVVEATSLTVEEFMQQFSDPTQLQCIETPAGLWD